jgi:hypothetical protein
VQKRVVLNRERRDLRNRHQIASRANPFYRLEHRLNMHNRARENLNARLRQPGSNMLCRLGWPERVLEYPRVRRDPQELHPCPKSQLSSRWHHDASIICCQDARY